MTLCLGSENEFYLFVPILASKPKIFYTYLKNSRIFQKKSNIFGKYKCFFENCFWIWKYNIKVDLNLILLKHLFDKNCQIPNTTVGFDMKMTLKTPPPPQKLNVSNISAVTDPNLMKLQR